MALLKSSPIHRSGSQPWSRTTVVVPTFPGLYRDPLHERPGEAAAFDTRRNPLTMKPCSRPISTQCLRLLPDVSGRLAFLSLDSQVFGSKHLSYCHKIPFSQSFSQNNDSLQSLENAFFVLFHKRRWTVCKGPPCDFGIFTSSMIGIVISTKVDGCAFKAIGVCSFHDYVFGCDTSVLFIIW